MYFWEKLCIVSRNCGLDATVYLDVHEFGTLECMVLVPYGITLTKPTSTEFPGRMGVAGMGPIMIYNCNRWQMITLQS